MSSSTDSQTYLTLMDLLRQYPKDAGAWDRFVRRYRPMIYRWCRERGLQEADAEDVAQDVIAILTQKMASFRHDPSRRFRAWLKTITYHALSDLINPRALGVGSALAKPGNAAIDDARVDLFYRFVINPEPVFHLRTEILDDHIGLLGQLEKDRLALLGLQVEGQAALVAVQILKVKALASRAGDIAPRFARRLDLDHIGAPIGELAHRCRPGASMTEVENSEAGQRQGSDAHDEVSSLDLARPQFRLSVIATSRMGAGRCGSKGAAVRCRRDPLTDATWRLPLWPRAEIAGPRTDHQAALILLDRVCDPANRAADDEDCQRAVARQPQPKRRRGKREIDIGTASDQAQPGFRGFLDEGMGFGGNPSESCEERGRARVALGIERLAEPRQALAACQPADHDHHRIAVLRELAKQALRALGLAAVKPSG